MAKDINQQERERLLNQLTKLGDLIAGDDEWGAQRTEYNREYRKIMKLLFPEMYPRKISIAPRKPSQKFIRTLIPCICGEKVFTYKSNESGIQILCKGCERKSGINKTNAQARDSWNLTFQPKLF